MRQIRAITFDAGGTLLHPNPSVGAIYAEVMDAHGLRLDPTALEAGFRRAWKQAHLTPRVGVSEDGEKAWWRAVVRETLRGLGEPEDFDALFESLWHAFAEPRRWALHEGARETLGTLRARGYRLAVLSNWDGRLRALLNGMELAPLFDEIIISSEVGFEKPDPRIFHVASERLNAAPEAILHVGDSHHHDVAGAQAAGWRYVLVTHRKDAAKEQGMICRLEELLPLLPG